MLWHAAYFNNIQGILHRGLVPGGEQGSSGHLYFQRMSPESPDYRPGSRAKCDVQVYVNHEHLLDQLPCFISRSDCVVTRAAVPLAFITEIVATYTVRNYTSWRFFFNCALLEKVVVGVRSPDHGMLPIHYDDWINQGWIEKEPDPGYFICPSCIIYEST